MNKQQIKQILEEEADLDKAIEQILALGDNSPNIQHLQPVNKLDYQILSFKQNSGITELWKVDTIRGSGYWSREGYMTTPYTTAEILSNKLYAIHSVKRLSDGEVFTIGDAIKERTTQTAYIIRFEITAYTLVAIIDSGSMRVMDSWRKVVTKTPLFKTEDGVDIYEGDKITIVNTKDFRISNTDIPENHIRGHCRVWDGSDGYLQFSSKQAAEEYIILNKPCLSLMDLKKAGYISASQTLKQLVKSKL